jgi:CHAT domain-containing protein
MGNAYVRSGDPEQAQEFYRKALEIQERLQDESNLLVTLNGLGLASLNQSQPQEALDFFSKSLQLARKTGNAAQEARVWTNLGWTYSELGRENDAYTAYGQALRLEERAENRGMRPAALLGLALLEERRGNPIAALVQAESAVSSVEELREDTSPDLKIAFMASRQEVYDALIDILLWLHELRPSEGHGARALQVSEQARSRRLLDQIRERSPALLSASRILSLQEIQSSLLGPETLLLEYHLGRRASYLWLVEETSLQIVRLPPREELEALAERTRGLVAASHRREKRNEARRVAVNLSQMLLGPAVGLLGRKRLLISVPTALQAVPFSVLPDPAALGPEARSEWPRPLMVNHEVIKVPSASVLAALRAREEARPAPEGLLALLADPVFDLRDERLQRPGATFQRMRSENPPDPLWGPFKRLPYAREEAESILGEVGARRAFSAFGFDVTRALVLSGRLRDFRNIHLATHGLLRSGATDLSALVLSQIDPHGRPQNGILLAAEIYGLDLPADLVTLSACETGLGEKVPGEGLMGLPHAFFTAGATRVLVSLWPVSDLATAKLMKRFYHEYLTRGLSPAAALQEAQKAMWQSRTHNAPFYWGGFELQGDWRAAESPH